MYQEFFKKNVKVVLKTGESISGIFSDAFSEYDNNGPATIIVGSTEIEEREIETIEIIDN